MENRGRKRTELLEQPPADKRACNILDHRSSSSSQPASTSEAPDCEMESPSSASVSGRSDRDSAYGSCDSDEPDQDYDPRSLAETKEKFNRIFSALSDDACPSSQLAALTELCDVLLLCTESSLASFSWESFLPILVTLSKHDRNPDIMLFAIRALTYLCDVMPRSAIFLVRYEAIPALVGPLLCIEYLDVAEQCLQALEKIALVHPTSCLQAGAIMAVLNYVEFFSPSIQNVALSTVANICKKLPSDGSSFVMEAAPILCNLLQYEDQKLVENVVVCFIRIVESLSHCSEKLDELCKHGLIVHSVRLAFNGRLTLNRLTYKGLIGMMATLATHSIVAVRTLLELNISSALRNILLATDVAHALPTPDGGVDSTQVHEILKLLNVLLPRLDCENTDSKPERNRILVECPELLHQFGKDIFPAMIQVVSSGASLSIWIGCLSVVNKLLYFSNAAVLTDLLKTTNFASFLATALTQKDHHVLVSALKATELAMQTLSDILQNSFIKEGVLFAIDTLQAQEKCTHSIQNVEKNQNSYGSSQKTCGNVPKCFCYALETDGMSFSLEKGTCRIENVNVQLVAKNIKSTYFSGVANNSDVGLSKILQKLRGLSTMLSSHVNSLSSDDESSQHDTLLEILKEINNRDDPVSTFEFIESGILKSLADFLSGSQCGRDEVDLQALLKRLQMFSRIFLLSSDTEKEVPLILLVRKLQNALGSLDRFPVIHSHASKSRNYYANIPAGRYTKYPCLKVRFLKGEGEILGDYPEETLWVEPLSSLDEVETFLWPKVSSSKAEVEDTENRIAESIEKEKADGSSREHKESCDMMESVPEEKYSFKKPKLVFFLEGKQLARSLTLYQSILEHQMNEVHDVAPGPRFWTEVYTLAYRKAADLGQWDSDQCPLVPAIHDLKPPRNLSCFSKVLVDNLSCNLDRTDSVYDILVLLKMLESLTRYSFHIICHERTIDFAEGRIHELDELVDCAPAIAQMEFLSNKLTEKLEQQMRDPLAISTGGMPVWCNRLVAACPFLFSFDARRKYFRLASFGPQQVRPTEQPWRTSSSRSEASNGRHAHTSGMPRERFQVYRDNIMESASRMMDAYAGSNAIIEVEYKEEVGTGLGPTMEFYTLISHEFQKAGLFMWRDDHGYPTDVTSGFISPALGLFPRPWSAASGAYKGVEFSEVIKKFVLLGQIVGKAIQDGRVLDLPFSKAFYKIVLGQELDIYDILSFDPQLGKTLLEFQALSIRNKILESNPNSNITDQLCFRNTRIEDLCLDFTLPGYSDYKLPCGDDYNMVTIDNLDEYVALVVDATLKGGISRQVEAFKSGFNQVFPVTNLQIFTEDEIERVLCGEKDTWVSRELLDHIKFDHGYTASSSPVVALLEIIEEFECEQRRAFLQFVTGAPRLPPGGLAALNPKLTIVRKHFHDSCDGALPSVMTCANYLKLPPYSSKERMRERLLYAITEGQGSFHLS